MVNATPVLKEFWAEEAAAISDAVLLLSDVVSDLRPYSLVADEASDIENVVTDLIMKQHDLEDLLVASSAITV